MAHTNPDPGERAAAAQAEKEGTEFRDSFGFIWFTLRLTDSNPTVTVRLDLNTLTDTLLVALSPATRDELAERLQEAASPPAGAHSVQVSLAGPGLDRAAWQCRCGRSGTVDARGLTFDQQAAKARAAHDREEGNMRRDPDPDDDDFWPGTEPPPR